MEGGFILIHRKLLDWEWYDDMKTTRLFMHLLLTANYKDYNWHGTIIKRGQVLISLRNLAFDSGLSLQAVRTAILKLKSTHELTHQTTHHFSIITIINYNTYQIQANKTTHQTTHQSTSQQHTINTPLYKEGKERKELKEDVSFSEDELFLCELLKEKILGNNPKAKIKNGAGWYKECRLLLTRDERTRAEVESVIRWSQDDKFWMGNILSMGKLRDKFDQLYVQMGRGKDMKHTEGVDIEKELQKKRMEDKK